jgi:putative copper export protein/mono/diheme cytochrome c family protein
MDAQSLLAGLTRGLGFTLLAAVFGGLILEHLIAPADVSDLTDARRGLWRWTTVCLFLLLLTTIGDLVVRTLAMSRAPLTAALGALPEVIARTHLGTVLTVRIAGLSLAILLSLAQVPMLRALCLLAVLGVALTFSLTAHTADWGDLTVSTVVDWTHVVAASAWIGGLGGLAWVLCRRISSWQEATLVIPVYRFARLAGVCLLAVVLTGSYNAWAQLGTVARLWTTAYGRVLLVKLLVVMALVWLGAVNRYVVLPRLSHSRANRGCGERLCRVLRLIVLGPTRRAKAASPASQLAAYVRREALLGLAVFACTAALGESTPGRHTVSERRPSSHVTLVQPRSQNNAARVGTVTPPPGNVEHGRAVFVRLQCFTCHTVQDQRDPAPSQPGPDLSGVGRHHTGYLVESIMNPSALIVDGLGYADARGVSIMPDYRDQLTLGELIDLVAYLQSL